MKETTTKQIPTLFTTGHVTVQERLRVLDKTERFAVLTTEADGQPYISLIAFALTHDMKGIVFPSQKTTRKCKNILTNKHVALLIDNRSAINDYMNIETITVVGTANSVMRGKKWSELSTLLITKHPLLADFTHDPTTSLIYVKAISYIHVNKFQTASH